MPFGNQYGIDLGAIGQAQDQNALRHYQISAAKREDEGANALAQYGPAALGGDDQAAASLVAKNPTVGINILNQNRALRQEKLARMKAEAPAVARIFGQVTDDASYQAALTTAKNFGLEGTEKMPAKYDPQIIGSMVKTAQGIAGPNLKEVPQGGSLVDLNTGQATYQSAPKVTKTVTTADGVYAMNPDGTRGNRLGDAPNQIPGLGGSSSPVAPGTPQVSGDDYLKTLPPRLASQIQAIAEGRELVSPAMTRTPQGINLLGAVTQYDPTFDASNATARAAQRKNYMGGGKQFQELQKINTVAGHLNDFMQAADALDNTSFPLLNSVKNSYLKNTGDPRIDRFNTVKQAVTNELSGAYRAGQITEGDVKEWQSNINSAQSPEQIKGVIGKMNDLLMSKRQALEEGYKQTMGATTPPAEFSSVNDRTRKIFDGIAKWSSGEKDQAPDQAPAIDPAAAVAELRRRGVIK